MPVIRSIRSARPRSRWRPRYCRARRISGRMRDLPMCNWRSRPSPRAWMETELPGLPGCAAATLFDSKTGAVHVATVDIGSKTVTAWREQPTKDHPYGQPPITIEEVFKVGDIVKADAGWLRAMKRRGLDDKDIELVQVDPFSAGYFDREVEKGRRLVSAVSYWRKDLKDNGYAHPDRRRGRARRPDREQDRPPRRRARRHSDPEEIAQLRPRLDPADAQRRQAAGCRAEGRPELYGRGLEGFLAELVVPRRLDRARGSRAAPDLVSRRCARAADHLPGQRHRHDRSLCRSDRQPFLEMRVRRRRVWARQARQCARTRLRLPRPYPLFRRAGRRRLRQARRHEECDLPARGGLRHPLEALRIPQRDLRGAALTPARHLVLHDGWKLRLRVLLVLLPGRHHPARSQAHRHHPDGGDRAGQALSVGRHGRRKSRRSDPPAFLQCPPAHDAGRRRQYRHRARVPAAAMGYGQSIRQRVRHHDAGARRASATPSARPTAGPGATGRSPIPIKRTASAVRRPTSSWRTARRSCWRRRAAT